MALLNSFAQTGALATTPWTRREDGGIYVGENRSVWLYRELLLAPLRWEDPQRRLESGSDLEGLLTAIGEKSRDLGQGVAFLSRKRVVHIVMVNYETACVTPAGTPEDLGDFMDQVLPSTMRAKALLVGVQLQSSLMPGSTRNNDGLLARAKAMLKPASSEDDSFLEPYRDDWVAMDSIMTRGRAVAASDASLGQLESWFNGGATADAPVSYLAKSLRVEGRGEYEISAVTKFDRLSMTAPYAQWLLDATTHNDPAVAVSIRAELEPASVTRGRLRKTRRRLVEAEAQESLTGDISRDENAKLLATAEEVERYVQETQTAWLSAASILLAREVSPSDETYADMLRNSYEIHTQVLVHRQMGALREMQPGCLARANPFEHDLTPSMVAYAGLSSFSNLGDPSGVWQGSVDPDYVPLFLDVFGASKNNKPPVMGVFGDPGSGKTFACQLICGQSALAGIATIFVNPKSADSLKPWARWVESQGAKVNVVSLSAVEDEGGAFDPFLFAEPMAAAEILTRHIQTAIGYAFTSPKSNILLRDGLGRGARAGARCAADALAYVEDEEVKDLTLRMAASSPLFRLGFGTAPREPWTAAGGLTLIEFDRELPLPKGGKDPSVYEPIEREALAAMRLVTRAAVEILIRAGGGVLAVDEAHHFLSSEEGLQALDRLAREGRSMGLLPIFATQRVNDLLAVDMETFVSRVLCMKLNDVVEATAALTLCRLDVTDERLKFLRDAGPRAGIDGMPGRPAYGVFRDLYDRHAVISIGPVPEDLRMAMSTNRTDRAARDAAEGIEQENVT